jgi:hypothetical protein
LRRSAAQLHALAQVEREIRASDPQGRRKYLRDYADAFQTYESVLKPEPLGQMLGAADVVLVGDYHALAAAQRCAARLLAQLASGGRPLVLGLEMLFVRDQHIVDEWLCGQIGEQEFRRRLRFDLEWGYDWQPYYELLETARAHGVRICGLDCTPRNDLRRIATRDRHAAAKIAELRERYPEAQVVVLFGESHLAPNHLPALLRERRPQDRLLMVLQNVDPLYWRAAGERSERVEAVRVNAEVVCVFSATPLEKYESYRQCLDRWRQERAAATDFAPSIYNLIEALLRFLNVDRYSPHNGTQPKFLVDMLPEVYGHTPDEELEPLLARKDAAPAEIRDVRAHLEERGSCYIPALNAIVVNAWQMTYAAEEAARFVHHACRASLLCGNGIERAPEGRFYTHVLEEALAYFGSRVLCPYRAAVRETDVYTHYAQPRAEVEEQTVYPYREFMEMMDFLVLHRDYESNARRYRARPPLLAQGLEYRSEKFDYVTRQLGYMLGSELYDAYLAGRVAKRFLRSLFFRKLDAPGAAQSAYFAAVRKIRKKRSN